MDAAVRGTNRQKSRFFGTLLALFLFWTGLGVGTSMSDYRYWIDSTWMAVYLECAFIMLYVIVAGAGPALHSLWRRHRLIADFLLMWGVMLLLSYLFSPYYSFQNPLAVMRLVETYTHLLFFLFLWDCFRRFDIDSRFLYIALVASTLTVMGYFVYIHFAYPELHADDRVFSIRSPQLLLNTHMHRISSQVETALVVLSAFLLTGFKEKAAVLTVFTLLAAFLLWLGGRAALLGVGVAFMFYMAASGDRMGWKSLLALMTLPPAVLGVMAYFQFVDLAYFSHALHKTFQSGSLDSMATGRLQVWSLALEKLNGHWGLGTGPQSYFFYPNRHHEVIHAHNFVLQFLGEWGVLGSAFLLFPVYRALRLGIVLHPMFSPEHRRAHLAAGLAMVALTVTALFSGVFFFHQTIVYFLFAMVIWITPPKPLSAPVPEGP